MTRKIIVTGATGFVGSNVVKQCIKHPSVDEVIVVTRKPIDEKLSRSPKITVIVHEEFSQWPDSVLDRLKGAQACIWAVGGKVAQFPDAETARKVGIGYPVVAAEAFRDKLCPLLPAGQPFRFALCSAWGAQRDQNAKLWVENENRKLKGAAENGVFDIAESSGGKFEAYALRAGGVIQENLGLAGAAASNFLPVVRADHLAKAFITICLDGCKERVLENSDITELGGLQSTLSINSLS